MKKYKVKIEPEALVDIQHVTDWYNKAQENLGKWFQNTTVRQINSLSKAPQIYAIRYKNIRCMLIKRFPYMVHFAINDENNSVEVLAVISVHRNPKIWEDKTKKSVL